MSSRSNYHKILEQLNQLINREGPNIHEKIDKLNDTVIEINTKQEERTNGISQTFSHVENNMTFIKNLLVQVDAKLDKKASSKTVNTLAIIIVSLFTAWLSALTTLILKP